MSNKSGIDVNKINLSPEDVDIIVQKATGGSSIKVLDYELVKQSGDTLGFATSHLILNIKIQRPDNKTQETLDYFAKVYPYGNSLQMKLNDELSLFDKEIFFFNKIVPIFKSNYDIKKWTPTCFLAKTDKIIMENLKNQGYQIYHTFFDKYDLLKSVITTVANFHSCSILAEAHLNKDLKDPIPLNERFPEVVTETQFADIACAKSWYDSSVSTASNIAKYLGKDPEDILKKYNRIPSLIKPSKIYHNVILHSDLWKNNIMFDEAKPLPNCILVDYQTTRYGPIVLDLLLLLHLNSSPAFRAKFEKELIDHYYSVLEETIKRNDPLVNIPTREEIDIGLQEFRIYGILMTCLYFPLSMLDPKVLTELIKDEEKYHKVFNYDRTDFVLENFEKDECYRTKVVEAITELAEIN